MKNPLYIIVGRVKLRDDNGPTNKLGEEKPYILFNGTYYPLSYLTDGPGVHPSQLVKSDKLQASNEASKDTDQADDYAVSKPIPPDITRLKEGDLKPRYDSENPKTW